MDIDIFFDKLQKNHEYIAQIYIFHSYEQIINKECTLLIMSKFNSNIIDKIYFSISNIQNIIKILKSYNITCKIIDNNNSNNIMRLKSISVVKTIIDIGLYCNYPCSHTIDFVDFNDKKIKVHLCDRHTIKLLFLMTKQELPSHFM